MNICAFAQEKKMYGSFTIPRAINCKSIWLRTFFLSRQDCVPKLYLP